MPNLSMMYTLSEITLDSDGYFEIERLEAVSFHKEKLLEMIYKDYIVIDVTNDETISDHPKRHTISFFYEINSVVFIS